MIASNWKLFLLLKPSYLCIIFVTRQQFGGSINSKISKIFVDGRTPSVKKDDDQNCVEKVESFSSDTKKRSGGNDLCHHILYEVSQLSLIFDSSFWTYYPTACAFYPTLGVKRPFCRVLKGAIFRH